MRNLVVCLKKLLGLFLVKKAHICCSGIPLFGTGLKIINRGKIVMMNDVNINSLTHIYTNHPDSEIELGDNVQIGRMSTISSRNSIIIKAGVLTGPHVFISDHNHEYRNPNEFIYLQGEMGSKGDRVLIEEGCWLGTNVVVTGNVRIGKQCVIGANSVVTKDIPDYSVAVGIPAKVVKSYNFKTQKWERV
jgi:acetyltransferase-like isoleucine patch superfamily enzyme